MAATALIRFTQGLDVGTSGQVLIGVPGAPVLPENTDNTGVNSWQVDLVYTPPGSAVPVSLPLGFSNTFIPFNAVFTPDVPGSYRIVLTVWDAINRTGTHDVDIRNFVIREANGLIIPPYQQDPPPKPTLASGQPGAKPNEMNVDGVELGWSGTGVDGLLANLVKRVDELPPHTYQGTVLTVATGGLPDFNSPASATVHGGDLWFCNTNVDNLFGGPGPGVSRVSQSSLKITERVSLGAAGIIGNSIVSADTKLLLVTTETDLATYFNLVVYEVIVGPPGNTTFSAPSIVWSEAFPGDTVSAQGAVYDPANNKLWVTAQRGVGVSFLLGVDVATLIAGTPLTIGGTGDTIGQVVYDPVVTHYADGFPRLYVGDSDGGLVRRIKNLMNPAPSLDGSFAVGLSKTTLLSIGGGGAGIGGGRIYVSNQSVGNVRSFNTAGTLLAGPITYAAVVAVTYYPDTDHLMVAEGFSNQIRINKLTAAALAAVSSTTLPPTNEGTVTGLPLTYAVTPGYLWACTPAGDDFNNGVEPAGHGFRVNASTLETRELVTDSTLAFEFPDTILWRLDGTGDVTSWNDAMGVIANRKTPVHIYMDQPGTYPIPPGSPGPAVVYDMKWAHLVAPAGPHEQIIVQVQRFATLHNLYGIEGGMLLQHNHLAGDPPVLTFSPLQPGDSCVFKVERGAALKNHALAQIPMIDWDGGGIGLELYLVFNELGTVEIASFLSGSAAGLGIATAPTMSLNGLTGMTSDYVGWAIQLSGAGLAANNKNFVITAFNGVSDVDVNIDATIGYAPDPNNGTISWSFVIPVVRVRNKGVLEVTVATGGLGEDNMMPPGWLGCDGSAASMIRWLHDGTLAFGQDFWNQHQQVINADLVQANTPMGMAGGSGDSNVFAQLPLYQGLGAPSDGTLFYDDKKQGLLAFSAEEGEWFAVGGRSISQAGASTLLAAVTNDYPTLTPGVYGPSTWARFHTIHMTAVGASDLNGLQYDGAFYIVPGSLISRPSSFRKLLINASAFNITAKHLAANTTAVSTLTLSANVANGDVVQFFDPDGPNSADRTYIFKTALTAGGGYAGEVLIGASASDSIDLLILAITGLGIPGVEYGIGTVTNTLVTAVAGAGDTMDVTSIEAGAWANGIEAGVTSVNMSWPGSQLTGGTGPLTRNQLRIAGGDFVVVPDGSLEVEYDELLGCWRVI